MTSKIKINYSRCLNDSTISKTKQSDIVSTSTVLIHDISTITLNGVVSDSTAINLNYNESLSDLDILFSNEFILSELNLSQEKKKNTWSSTQKSVYDVMGHKLKIEIIYKICNYTNTIFKTVQDMAYIEIIINNTYRENKKTKTYHQSISNNFKMSQKISCPVSTLFLDDFTQVNTELTISYNAPMTINGENYKVKSAYSVENELVKIGSVITNQITTMGTWTSMNTYNNNFSQKSYASNVYFFISQTLTWRAFFYPDLTQSTSIILVDTKSKIMLSSYGLIGDCSHYALIQTNELQIRTDYFLRQNISSYTLEQCFFDDNVNEAMTKQTGISFSPLTLNTLPSGSIKTSSTGLEKLFTINICKSSLLGLKILPDTQTILNSVQVGDGMRSYSGLGTIRMGSLKLNCINNNNDEVVANSLSSTTEKNGNMYWTFVTLPEVQPDNLNIDYCDITAFLLSGSQNSVFYRINGRSFYRFTDSNEYIEVNTFYE
jgi:hypothetical protein